MVLEMVCKKRAAHFLTFDGKRRREGGMQTGNGQDPGHAKSENTCPKNRASGWYKLRETDLESQRVNEFTAVRVSEIKIKSYMLQEWYWKEWWDYNTAEPRNNRHRKARGFETRFTLSRRLGMDEDARESLAMQEDVWAPTEEEIRRNVMMAAWNAVASESVVVTTTWTMTCLSPQGEDWIVQYMGSCSPLYTSEGKRLVQVLWYSLMWCRASR